MKTRLLRLLMYILIALVTLSTAGLAITIGLYLRYLRHADLPPLSIFEDEKVFQAFPFSARVFAKNMSTEGLENQFIGEYYLNERRFYIAKDDLPHLKLLTEALLASEDRYFFTHPGINPAAIAGALYQHYVYKRPLRGASTLTQQLTKNVLRRGQHINIRERSVGQKIQEMYLAYKLEQYLTLKYGSKRAAKEHILWLYLNIIPMGRVNGGFAAAAYDYFGIQPEKLAGLTTSQALVLAALPKGPEKYLGALNSTDRAKPASMYKAQLLLFDRMRYIAEGMVRTHALTTAEVTTLFAKPFEYVAPNPRTRECDEFLTEVQRTLADHRDFLNGLHPISVYTTCTVPWQRQARQALKQQTQFVDERNGELLEPQGAAVFTEMEGARRGAVTVMVGSRESFVLGNFNRALQARRSAGSTFKLPVYYLLLKEGLSPNTSVSTARVCLPPFHKGLPAWCPKNAYPTKADIVSAEYALAHSINTATARFVALLNNRHGRRSFVVQAMIDLLVEAGIPRHVLAVQPSLPLGPSGVTPLELAQFYAAMTHGGTYVKPYLVEACVDERSKEPCDLGEIMRREEREIADPKAAGLVTHMLVAASQPGGTAARVGTALAGHEIAVKTGTSQNNGTTWLVGCTREICGTVWVGFDEESLGLGVDIATGKEWQGGRTAGPPWADTAKFILSGRKPQRFSAPTGVIAVELVKETTTLSDGTPAIGIRCVREKEKVEGKLSYIQWYAEERRPNCALGYLSKRSLAPRPYPAQLPAPTPKLPTPPAGKITDRQLIKTG